METVEQLEEQPVMPNFTVEDVVAETTMIEVSPAEEVSIVPATPFTIESLLRQIKTLPNTNVIVEEPFAEVGDWGINIHGTTIKTKWLCVFVSISKQQISVETFMEYNAIAASWRMINNKPVIFTTIDDAMTDIKSLLGLE